MDIQDVLRRARGQMLKRGGHAPLLLIEDARGRVVVSVLDRLPQTTLLKEKLLFLSAMELALEHDLDAGQVRELVWVCEAWSSHFTREEELASAPPPSEDPRRKEGLLVRVLTVTPERRLVQTFWWSEVIRAGGTVDLLPPWQPDEVESPLLYAALAGVCAASLDERDLEDILAQAQQGRNAAAEEEVGGGAGHDLKARRRARKEGPSA